MSSIAIGQPKVSETATAARRSEFGAVPVAGGTRFRVYSKHATGIELCLFDGPESLLEKRRIPLQRAAGHLWQTTVPEIVPGQLYGYRVAGPYAPQEGHRFNRAKLLMDPWARAITGEPCLNCSLFGYSDRARPDLSFDGRDSAPFMPRSVVADPAFEWQGVEPPRTPWRDTVIYETHVRALTRLHPEIEPRLRGTYPALAAPPVIEYLKRLGVTAVEILPVHQIAREPHLLDKGLPNAWGYSTLGFFAPHAGYATSPLGEQVGEWKAMVRELHRAGIEVILDVVYNHTAEGDHLGPTLSFRGFDNRTFYLLRRRNRRRYIDYSGCGNTLDLARSQVREMVLESLRYWVEEMHVDGFRFDLATTLGRHGPPDAPQRSRAFHSESAFFATVTADPVLSQVKLIAEPWDLGHGGYQLGRFPAEWAEWNDRFRDGVRGFWRGDPIAGEVAARIAGSEDLFAAKGPLRSVHFVSCHDGYTLRDVTRYEAKHNEANREGNRDGHGHNVSRNWGVEGPTDDARIIEARDRARRNLLATVFLSPGVPMLLYGDEMGRTQQGNNNAYCQDELSWLDWSLASRDAAFLRFVRRLTSLRQRFKGLRREVYAARVEWWRPDGKVMEPSAWDGFQSFATVVPSLDSEGDLILLLNGSEEAIDFASPSHGGRWTDLLDTARPDAEEKEVAPPFALPGFSLRLLLRH